MAIWVKELTGSSAWAGLVMFCYAIGNLSSPLGGVIADRFRRRPMLICANLLGFALVLLNLLVHGRGQIWIIYLAIFLSGVLAGAITPALTALLPALVPEDLLAEANGAQQTLNEGLRLVTPLIGAGLFALAGGAVVAEIDAATFLVAVAALLALRIDEPKPAPHAAGDESGRMTAGFRFIRREPVLRSITLALALAMLAFGFTESAVFSVVTTGLHHRPTFTGVLLAAQGTGAVVAGLVAAPILRRMPEGMMTALALCCAVAAVLLLTLPSVVLVFVGVVLAGFVGPWVSVAAITAIQRRTPSDLLGRVAGAFGLSLTAPQVASVGLGAALIAVVSYRMLLSAVAVVAALAVAYLLSRPETRHRAASEGPPGWRAPAAPG
jgi:MFS family permease